MMKHFAALACLSLLAASPLSAEQAPAPTTIAQSSSFIGTSINITDRARSLKFYTELLGLTLVREVPLGTRNELILNFPGAAGQPSLILMHDVSPNAPKALTPGTAFSRLVIRVTDLAALAAKMDANGFKHDQIRESGQAGYSIMMATDPDGIRIEFVQQTTPRPRS